MLERLFPRHADNTYRGSRVALVLLGAVLLQKIAMGFNVIFNGAFVARTADGIPLDSYAPDAARAVLALFAAWGVGQLTLCALGTIVVARYRSLVPLAIALLLAEHLTRRAVMVMLPIVRTGSPPGGLINLGLLVLLALALVLSLRVRALPPVAAGTAR